MTTEQRRALADLIEAVELAHCVEGLPADLEKAVQLLVPLLNQEN